MNRLRHTNVECAVRVPREWYYSLDYDTKQQRGLRCPPVYQITLQRNDICTTVNFRNIRITNRMAARSCTTTADVVMMYETIISLSGAPTRQDQFMSVAGVLVRLQLQLSSNQKKHVLCESKCGQKQSQITSENPAIPASYHLRLRKTTWLRCPCSTRCTLSVRAPVFVETLTTLETVAKKWINITAKPEKRAELPPPGIIIDKS